MKRLDRYIIQRFLATFFFILLLFMAIAIIIDITDNLDEMLEANTKFIPILNYYLDFAPYISALLAPLFVLISVIFFTSRLTNNSEIIASVSGGVSFYRLLVPYLVAGLTIATLFFFGNHFLIPKANADILEFKQVHLEEDRTMSESNNIHLQVDSNRIMYLRNYNASAQRGRRIQIETFDGNNVVEKMKANSLEYIDSTKTWMAEGITFRKNFDDREEVITKKKQELDIPFLPEDFVIIESQWESLSTPKLNQRLKREREKGSNIVKYYQVEKHKRTTTPISIIIFTIIGFAIASRKVRGGIGIHLFVGLVLSGIFVVILEFSKIIATQTTANPLIALWTPNVIFALFALVLIVRAQK